MAINEKMKWPTDKPRYDKNYLKLYGKQCPVCDGDEIILDYNNPPSYITCFECGGIGYVRANSDNSEKKK